jgi:O-antigen/teichoic acid export membrane protein
MSKAADINIRKQATISFAGTLADTGISFAGLIAMAYILGASGLGQYYLILAVVNVALFPVNGLGQAVLKRASEERHDASVVYGTGVVLALVYAAVVALATVGLVASDLVSIRFGTNIVLVAVTVFVSRAALNTQIDAYRGYGHTGHATLVDNVYGILQTIIQLGALALGLGIFGLLAATTVATIATFVGHYLVSVVSVSWPRLSVVSSLFEYGRWSVLSSGISTVYQRLPVLFLGFLGMDAAIGYYKSADQLLMLGSYFGAALAPALMAKTSSQTDNGSTESMFKEFKDTHHHVSLLAVAFAFGSFALADSLMTTFFDMTDPLAATALIILSFFHLVKTFSNLEYSFLKGLDMPELGTRSISVAFVVQAILIPTMFHFAGFIGIVTAIVISHTTTVLYAQAIFWNKFGMIPLPGGLFRQGLSGIIMFLAVEAAAIVIGISTVFHLLVIIALGGLVYISVLVFIDSGFRELAQSTLKDTLASV